MPAPEITSRRSGGSPSLRWIATALVLASIPATSATPLAADGRTKCDVAFVVGELPPETTVGFLDLRVQYGRPKVFPPDAQGRVRCFGLPADSTAAATNRLDNSSTGTMTVAFASVEGGPAGSALLRCEVYVAGGSAQPGDFSAATVLQARDTDLEPIDPLPSISIGQIRCGSDAGTTTTTSTSTTTTVLASTTSTTLGPEVCSFRMRLASKSKVRRVRFELDWSRALGRVPRPVAASCTPSGSIGAFVSGLPGEPKLVMDTVSVPVLSGPIDLARCDFVPTGGYAVSSDFVVTAVLAGDENGAAAATLPDVETTDVECPSRTTTTTTTTTTLPPPLCGDADGDGDIKATDALVALRAAVGLPSVCIPQRCDVDDSGTVSAGDALRILQVAVGFPVSLNCPA